MSPDQSLAEYKSVNLLLLFRINNNCDVREVFAKVVGYLKVFGSVFYLAGFGRIESKFGQCEQFGKIFVIILSDWLTWSLKVFVQRTQLFGTQCG